MTERDIFLSALSIADRSQRTAYLASACQGDAGLQCRIESLLEAVAIRDSFLQVGETQSSDEPSAPNTQEQLGPYKLLEKIGEGGFGIVYMAEQTYPIRRLVAVKVIKPGMDSRQIIARFEAERQVLAIMDHPNIAKVLDAGTSESGRPYFVMELVKGTPITQFCDDRHLPLHTRLELFVSVCHAIQHAHGKGIIHRDIKPGNVLVAMFDDAPVTKVIDFGVAKAMGPSLTERTLNTGFGMVVGSIEYMSPEQASFNQLDIDTRSDVYSLGVLLYELLTGSPPLSRDELHRLGLMESLRHVREWEAPRPSLKLSTAQGLPSLAANRGLEPARLTTIVRGDLDWIAMKALDKDRNRRYETVQELTEEVQRYLRGEPIRAHPPSWVYVCRKAMARHRRSLAATGSSLLLVGVLTGLLVWRRSEDARQRKEHSGRVRSALLEAALAAEAARAAPIGRPVPWVTARAAVSRVTELISLQPIDQLTRSQADEFLAQFQRQDADRKLAEHIEQVVMLSATHPDLGSWERMERQFRELFAEQGIDMESVLAASAESLASAVQQAASQIQDHRSVDRLRDALELWIGTRGQISGLGGSPATRQSMQPLASTLLAADSDPVRTGIRRLIFGNSLPTESEVDAVVDGVPWDNLSARTLSWLASVYSMARSDTKSSEVFRKAVIRYPDDFMLNFDFAYVFESRKKYPEAIRYYLRCSALRPDVSGIWHALGNAYRENGEHAWSRDALERSLHLAADHGPIRTDLAKTLLELGEFSEAEKCAMDAIRLGDTSPWSDFVLAKARWKLNRYAEALVALDQCQRKARKSSDLDEAAHQLASECRRALAIQPMP